MLRRDLVTASGYATLATLGWFIYTLGPTVPLLRLEQDTSRTLASMHSVASAMGVIIAGLIAVRVLRRIGRDGGIRLGSALLAVGAVGLIVGSLPDGGAIVATLAAVFVASVGGALAVNAATAVLADGHGAAGPAAVAEGNAVAATIGLLAPLVVGVATAWGLTWRAAMALLVPLAAIVWLFVIRSGDAPVYTPATAADDLADAPLPRAYWLLWVALVACVMVEAAFVTWTPDLLRDRVGMGVGAASATPAAFLAGMAVGRFAVARLSLRLATLGLFVTSLVVAGVGWAVLWTASAPVAAMSGLILAGLGVAAHFPMGSVLLIDASGGQADRALGLVAVGLGVAVGAGPFVLGSFADLAGIYLAFLVIPACLVVAVSGTALAVRAAPSGRT